MELLIKEICVSDLYPFIFSKIVMLVLTRNGYDIKRSLKSFLSKTP